MINLVSVNLDEVGRDFLGELVREAWVKWAESQPDPKPHWLVPYHQLREEDKEADRQIGEAVFRYTLARVARVLDLFPGATLDPEPSQPGYFVGQDRVAEPGPGNTGPAAPSLEPGQVDHFMGREMTAEGEVVLKRRPGWPGPEWSEGALTCYPNLRCKIEMRSESNTPLRDALTLEAEQRPALGIKPADPGPLIGP